MTSLSRVGDEYINLPKRFGLRKTGFCKLIDCILVVSNRNVWFIAFHNEESNTVGLYIPGSSSKAECDNHRTISIPGRFNDTGKQFKNMEEHNVFTWPWATNFFPLEPAECEHINRIPIDNRRSNVPLCTKDENNGNRETGVRHRS